MNVLVMGSLRRSKYLNDAMYSMEGPSVRTKLARWLVLLPALAALAIPALAQSTLQTDIVKHLTTSRDFTLKVADAMPAADYGFKLTPPQMSFGGR